jgi:uncharacterized protein (TIGR03086 family)
MDERDIFILAERTLRGVIDQIEDDQWDLVVPAGVTRQPATLREAINYHAYDSAWVPDTLAGRTIEEVGSTYDGDLLGDEPKERYAEYSERAVAAVRALTDLGRTVHLTYGDYAAGEYLKHITSFRGFRVYDLAKLIGADTAMPADLVQGMWDELGPSIEEWRQMGIFGPAVKVPQDASLQDRLLGLSGRDPHQE